MDTIVALGVLGIIAMIILPVNPILLDILLVFNITFALIIFVLTMFTTSILEFSVFPTLLLVTTLFRLGLNISSTRLILSNGEAGSVIQAFGSFVAGGNYIVGAIIFIIIVVIQFLVITNGAGRVSEVAARFTLDAMPGKQMSIDADLNAGSITDVQAKQRREDLQREADFYGTMDGASKFVKGDAIAGIIIVIINFIGGIAIFSIQKGVGISKALEQFGILTIGDGLVGQIPALLISIGTGMLVTRSNSKSDFGTEMSQQLFAMWKVIGIVSALLIAVGSIPAFPTPPFYLMAVITGGISYLLYQDEKNKVVQDVVEVSNEEIEEPPSEVRVEQYESLEIEISYDLIPLVDKDSGGDLVQRISSMRRQIANELGLVIRPIRIRDNLMLSHNEYSIKIRGIEVAKGTIIYNKLLVMDPGSDNIDLEGIPTVEPAFGLPALWVDEKQKDMAEIKGYTVVDPTTVLITHLKEVIKLHSHELITRQDVNELVEGIKEENSAVVEELIPDLLSLGEVQKILQNLLRENVSIRDMVTILETLADYAVNTKDIELLTEYVRYKLGRSIVMEFLDTNKKLNVITIHPQIEKLIGDNIQKSIQGSFPAIDPNINTRILQKIHSNIDNLAMQGKEAVVLAAPKIRPAFKRMIEIAFPKVPVISLNEIPNYIDIEAVGMVKLDDS
ncbi:flagellar biosynthesis protein FlhA [Clostridium sediminicola]|uniref:flagellar biosynthesis protein FlhA n=1 Tax=Clostridium sediminicola TaxID=3114879 RepID=UPI003D1638DC